MSMAICPPALLSLHDAFAVGLVDPQVWVGVVGGSFTHGARVGVGQGDEPLAERPSPAGRLDQRHLSIPSISEITSMPSESLAAGLG